MPVNLKRLAFRRPFQRVRHFALAACLLTTLSSCDWWASKSFLGFGDDRGYWLPLTVALRYDPSVVDAALDYKDNCLQAKALPFGASLSEALTRQIGLVFEHVQYDARSSKGAPDGAVEVTVGLKELDLFLPPRREGTYTAKLTLGGTANYFDQAGNLLYTKNLRVENKGKAETDSRSCDVRGLDKLAAETSMLLAEGLKKHLGTATPIRRAAQEQQKDQKGGRRAVAGVPAVPAPPLSSTPAAVPPSSVTPIPPVQVGEPIPLSFRAMLRDENANQVLEGGERVTVKAEVTNTGSAPATGLTLALSGSPALVQAFRNPVPVGDLQPGETKRVEVSGKLPAVARSEQAELVIAVESASGIPQTSKKFIAALRPAQADDIEVLSVDVDQVPARVRGFERRKAVGIAIGVGKFREAEVSPVKFAAHDAETMAKYFRTVGGIPPDQIKVLTDERALKEDLAEAFEEWLPRQIKKDGIVFVFFSGRAVVDAAGAVSLVPHEGGSKSSARLFSVRRLHSALARLPIQHAILILDVSLEGSGADRAKKEPNWNTVGEPGEEGKFLHVVSVTGLQEAHRFDRGRHGLFTYYVLKGLSGAADGDRDGQIIVAELFDYAREQVLKSAKTEYGNEQEPALVPELSPNAKVWDLPLARVTK
jgi:hypothetical protein